MVLDLVIRFWKKVKRGELNEKSLLVETKEEKLHYGNKPLEEVVDFRQLWFGFGRRECGEETEVP